MAEVNVRLWRKVAWTDDVRDCWPWIGGIRSNGYGQFSVRRADGAWTKTSAHRAIYESAYGVLPRSHEPDHLCRNRACCNPFHLEGVTLTENRRRRDACKTACVHGHPYTAETTYRQRGTDGYTSRTCRVCRRMRRKVA